MLMKCGLLWSGFFFLWASCVAEQPSSKTVAPTVKKQFYIAKKVLIVYLSRTKNTEAVAKIIHKKIGGELIALELVSPYPENYQSIVDQVADENARNYLPPLKTKIDNIQAYDVVFLGFPTWGMQLPPPMKSFLHAHDLSGKTVVPFNTHAGYGIGSSFDTLKKLCPKSNVLEGFSTSGGKEKEKILLVIEGRKEKEVRAEIDDWLKKIGLSN